MTWNVMSRHLDTLYRERLALDTSRDVNVDSLLVNSCGAKKVGCDAARAIPMCTGWESSPDPTFITLICCNFGQVFTI